MSADNRVECLYEGLVQYLLGVIDASVASDRVRETARVRICDTHEAIALSVARRNNENE